MGIILLKMPQWLISVFNWFTLSSMKKIIITQMLIAIIITMFDKACEIILKGPCVWDIQDVVAFIILDTCLLYTSPSPRDRQKSRMPSSA